MFRQANEKKKSEFGNVPAWNEGRDRPRFLEHDRPDSGVVPHSSTRYVKRGQGEEGRSKEMEHANHLAEGSESRCPTRPMVGLYVRENANGSSCAKGSAKP